MSIQNFITYPIRYKTYSNSYLSVAYPQTMNWNSENRMCRMLIAPTIWYDWLIVLGFNDTSVLVGHFVSSPREREKRDWGDSRRDEREGQERQRNRNEIEETEEIKTSPVYPYLLQGYQVLSNCKPISVGRPGDVSYTTPSHHPTTPNPFDIKNKTKQNTHTHTHK